MSLTGVIGGRSGVLFPQWTLHRGSACLPCKEGQRHLAAVCVLGVGWGRASSCSVPDLLSNFERPLDVLKWGEIRSDSWGVLLSFIR